MDRRERSRNGKKSKKTVIIVDKTVINWYIYYCQLLLVGFFGRLAQLVRASALQAEGHRFESYIAHHFVAEIAQLVEQLICNQ